MMVEPKREILLVPLLRIGLLRAWTAREDFIRLAIVPLILLLVIAAPLRDALLGLHVDLDGQAPGGATPPRPDAGALLQGIGLALLEGAAFAIFVVNWVRQLTLGRTAVPGLGLAIAGRHVRFLLVMLAIVIGVTLPGMILAAIVIIALQDSAAGILATVVLGMLLWTALIARLSPAWIGIAIDARMPLAVAWARTAGQGFKLVLAVLAVEVMTMLLHEFITQVLMLAGFIAMAPYSYMLLSMVVGLAGLAAQVAILVTAFPHFLRETV